MKYKIAIITCIVLYIFLYIVPLGVRPMVIPDEFRYAEIPREMLETGDWVVPHLDGLRYFEKPVLGYWLNAIGIAMFGENAFAIRFFSAVAAGISAVILFFLARKYAGGYRTGIFVTTIFLTCSEVFSIGTISVLDSMFSMFLTAAMALFFYAHMEDGPRKRVCLLVLSGISCGLAFLTKGFLAFAIPAVTVIPFLIWQRRTKEIFRILWIPFVTAILVALPWCLMIYAREKDFWHYFFWSEHVHRLVSGEGGQHPQPFWFFIPCILVGAFPWIALLPAAISGLKGTRFKDPLFRYAICWLLLPFLLLSASSGKLITYILPCFPPLAIIMSMALLQYFATGKKKAFTVAVNILLVIMVVIMSALILIQTIPTSFRVYEQQESRKIVLMAIGFLAYILLLFCATRAMDFRKKLAFFAIGPTVLMFCGHFAMPNQFRDTKAPGEFLRYNRYRVHSDTVLVSDNNLASSVCWCYKRSDIFFLGGSGKLKYGLGYAGSKQRLLDIDQFKKLIDQSLGKGCVTLITSEKRYAEYRQLLPKSIYEHIESGFVFAEFTSSAYTVGASLPAQKAQNYRAGKAHL
ncbi:phospholipid carrier-dependent glycosyltransferase [Planctomycetota bacterium]